MGFRSLPDRSLIQHLQVTLQANLEHEHIPEDVGRSVLATFTRIAERLRETERKRPVAVQPIRWGQDDSLLDRYLVA